MAIDDPLNPASAVARFNAAENRLYPLAMVDTEMFERATLLVGLIVTELRSCNGVAEVLAQLDGIVARLPESAVDAGIESADLPLTVIAEAAAAMRCRELKAKQSAIDARERIERARAEGQTWLVDEASPAMAMAGIEQRQERHLPTGATLITSTDTGTPPGQGAYTLELIPGNPDYGVVAVSETFEDRSEWLAAAERLRAELQ